MPFDPSTARPFTPEPAPAPQPAAPAAAAQPQQQQPQQPDDGQGGGGMMQDAGKMLWTALHSAADTGTMGLADKASAELAHMISPITGQPMSYDEAYARVKSNGAKWAGESPVSAGVGDVAGMVVGAGKIAKAAKMIPGVGRLMQGAEAVEGQGVRNVLKSAAVGATGAAGFTGADEAIRNGNVNPDNVLLSAAAGGLLGPLVSKVGGAMARGVQNSSTKAMMVLAKRLDESPETLQKVYDNFQAATGRLPTMAEIVGMKSQGELKRLAQDNPLVQAAVNDADEMAGAQRSRSLSHVVETESGGPVQDVNDLVTARKARMDDAMKPIRNQKVPVDSETAGFLSDPRVRSAIREDPQLSGRVRDAIQEATDEGGAGESHLLSVDDLDSIRKSIRGRQSAYANPANAVHNPHIAQQFGNLADHIASIVHAGDDAHPYAQALDQFAKDSNYIKGFKHGMAGKTVGEADKPDLISALAEAEGKAGHSAGITARTANAAAESPDSAVRVAGELARGTGDSANLRSAIGQGGFSRVQAAGDAEAKGAEALRTISGKIQPEDQTSMMKHVGQAAGAIAAHSPTTVVYHAAKAIPSFKKLSPAVQKQVAKYLTDPKMTQQGINLLRHGGAKDAEIRKLAVALSASTGLNAASAMEP